MPVLAAGVAANSAPAAAATPAGALDSQSNRRYCVKRHSLFFRGHRNDGACAAGGGHHADGFDFNLPHDMPETVNTQRNRRFCDKRFVIFRYGAPSAGHCPTADGHRMAGYDFVPPCAPDPPPPDPRPPPTPYPGPR